jgi:NAD(P)-dependent dehydrogenase (short-subunit alcohol dehydrogenase family)
VCEPKLKGKKAIVTGSGTGIGREIALEFARQGANVVFHYSSSAAGALSGVEEAKKLGVKALAIKADFSKLDDVLKLGKEALEFLGSIDYLINNAGITFNKPFLKVEAAQFEKIFDVNIRAQFFLTQKIVEHLTNAGRGGAIVNITSIHGISGAPEHSVYAGTKGAIIAYTRSLAMELAHKGIRVNAIAPGWVTVENYDKVLPGFNRADAQKVAYDKVPVARYGDPIDIAKIAVFLCSEDSSFIIGQTIVADGGTTSLMSLISDFRNESSACFGANYL